MLTDEEIKHIADFLYTLPDISGIEDTLGNLLRSAVLEGAKAQDAKIASILKAQEQERVKRIFNYLQKHGHSSRDTWHFEIDKEMWQALKKQEGVK